MPVRWKSSVITNVKLRRESGGVKTTVKQTKHTTTNRVTEFIAGGNLSLLSRDDSTYEASKIEAKRTPR